MSKTFAYARVSTKEQNLDRQLNVFKEMGIEERDIITDKASGKNLNRPGYQTLRNQMLRNGDTLIIKSLDRLSRNKSELKDELQWYKDNNIRLKVLDIPTSLIDIPQGQEWILDMINNILIEVLASIAEQERVTIKQRQAEGIKAAKQKGVSFGRPKATFPENWLDIYTQWKQREITATKAMDLLQLKKNTFYKLVKEHEAL